MALKKCEKCGHMISDKAKKCPKCGTRISIVNLLPQSDNDEDLNETLVEYEEERNYKYHIITFLVIAILVGGGYWWYNRNSDDTEVRLFVDYFATAVQNGDKTTMYKLYPNAVKAESLHIDGYNKDSITIIHKNDNDTIDVKLTKTQSIRLKRDASNDKMQIVSSKGLFVFPVEQMDFAIKTGMVNKSLEDGIIAERLNDPEFIPWIIDDFENMMLQNLKVAGELQYIGDPVYYSFSEAMAIAIVENHTNFTIYGEDYDVIFKGVFVWQGVEEDEKVETCGENVAPGTFVKVSQGYNLSHNFESAYVKFKLNKHELYDKYFKPQGDEYERYIKAMKYK